MGLCWEFSEVLLCSVLWTIVVSFSLGVGFSRFLVSLLLGFSGVLVSLLSFSSICTVPLSFVTFSSRSNILCLCVCFLLRSLCFLSSFLRSSSRAFFLNLRTPIVVPFGALLFSSVFTTPILLCTKSIFLLNSFAFISVFSLLFLNFHSLLCLLKSRSSSDTSSSDSAFGCVGSLSDISVNISLN